MWIVLRKINLSFQISRWTGFNINLHKNRFIIHSKVGYLDCLDAPATAMCTIYCMMEHSFQINVKSIVCVYDRVIYAKAYQTSVRNKRSFKNCY